MKRLEDGHTTYKSFLHMKIVRPKDRRKLLYIKKLLEKQK